METRLVNLIINTLNGNGHFVWRNNSGVVKNSYTNKKGVSKQRMWRAGVKGGSDILGIAKNGRFIAIECKVKPNKPTVLQEAFLNTIESYGGYAIVAYSLEDIEPILSLD